MNTGAVASTSAHPGFEPSAVYLQKAHPLFNTFSKAESETAAAVMLVTMCARKSWEAVSLLQCAAEFMRFAQADLEATWPLNPFLRPNFGALVDDGFAEWIGDPGFCIRFTERGYERLAKWVRP